MAQQFPRGIYEKVRGSRVFWIRYTDAAGNERREKCGTFTAAKNRLTTRRFERLKGEVHDNPRAIAVGTLTDDPLTRKPNARCTICEKPIYRSLSELQRTCSHYCGRRCLNIARRKVATCVVCERIMIDAGVSSTCSARCANELRLLSGRKAPQGMSRAAIIERDGNKCFECETGPEWNGKPLYLQEHHKDGNRSNEDISNKVLLCPNCHTQTENYGAKNRVKKHGISKSTPAPRPAPKVLPWV